MPVQYIIQRPKPSDKRLNYREFCRMIDLIEMAANAEFSEDFSVVRNGKRMRIALQAGAKAKFDWSEVEFGFEINPDGDNALEIEIKAGHIGSFLLPAARVVLPSEAGDYYVAWKFDGDWTLFYQETFPQGSYVLYQFTVANSKATLKNAVRPFLREAMDWSHFAFGYLIDGATVTVRGGALMHGLNWYETNDTEITITASNQYIYLTYAIGSSIAIQGPAAAVPTCTISTLYFPLGKFGLEEEQAFVAKCYQLGNICIPALRAPGD